MRRVIFFHVPKCAGTTVYEHLEQSLGRTKVERIFRIRPTILIHTKHHAEQLPEMIKTGIKARLVYGHMDWDTYERLNPKPTDYLFTFLRNPMDRLRSSYNYFCSEQGWEWSCLSGKPEDYTFETYLEAAMEADRWSVDNVSVRMFSGSIDCAPSADQDWRELLELAKDRISQMDFVGFQENMHGDIKALSLNLGLTSWQAGRKRTTQKTRSVEDSLNLRAKIASCTKWDDQLFEFAKLQSAKKTARS
jgi:hypothetical protein